MSGQSLALGVALAMEYIVNRHAGWFLPAQIGQRYLNEEKSLYNCGGAPGFHSITPSWDRLARGH